MGHPDAFIESSVDALLVVVVSQVCLFHECVSQALAADSEIQVLLACSTLDLALAAAAKHDPHMILLDARFPGGAAAAGQLRETDRATRVVAMALEETADNIVTWAEAGILGYIPDTASMREFPRLLRQIHWGHQACAPHVVGGLLRRIARQPSSERHCALGDGLTPRERLIGEFIGAGMSNKDIARELDISLGTTKAHVHNILSKLNLSSRAQVAARLHRLPR